MGVRAYFRNQASELARLRETVEYFIFESNLDALTGHRLHVILEELFTNVVKYSPKEGGWGEGAQGMVIALVRKEDRVRIDFADDGAPFNPLTLPEPELDEDLEERPVGGLGIHLVRRMTERASYKRDGDWNRLQLVCLNSG